MRKRTILTLLTSLLLISSVSSLLADTVYLRDGRVLKGKVTAQSQQMIQLTVNGQPMMIQKNQIVRISYEKELTDAEKKAEADRQAEAARLQELERQRLLLEAQKRQEEAARLKEEAQRKKEEAARLKEEERRKKEEARQKAEDDRNKVLRPTSPVVVSRSLYFPGYAQYTSGHKKRGITYMVLFFSSLAAYAYAQHSAGVARAAYNNDVTNYWMTSALLGPEIALLGYNDTNKRLYLSRTNQANAALALTAAIYGVQLADAHSLTRSDTALAFSRTWRF